MRTDLADKAIGTEAEIEIDDMSVLDLHAVCTAEKVSFPLPFTFMDLQYALTDLGQFCLVARDHDRVIGHIVFEDFPHAIHVHTLAVNPGDRFCGVGGRLIRRAKREAIRMRINAVEAPVKESNAGGRSFLRKCGFTQVRYLQPIEDEAWGTDIMRWDAPLDDLL